MLFDDELEMTAEAVSEVQAPMIYASCIYQLAAADIPVAWRAGVRVRSRM